MKIEKLVANVHDECTHKKFRASIKSWSSSQKKFIE